MPAPGSMTTMSALMGTTSMTEARELSRRFLFPNMMTETEFLQRVEDEVEPLVKAYKPQPGELFGRLLEQAMVTEPMVEAVLEASGRCGVQLERWQAKVLAGASMAASDLLWWPPGGPGSTTGRASSVLPDGPGSPSARSAATARTGSGRGRGRRFG